MAFEINCDERDLEDVLFARAEKFLPDITPVFRQYRTPHGVVDIIARDDATYRTERRNYFVIELKKGPIDTHTLAQSLRYCRYLNAAKNRDGRRLFIPFLIGDSVSPNLHHLLTYYDGYADCGHYTVYYRLYGLSPETGLSFNFHATEQRRIESEFEGCPTRYERLENDIEYLEYRVASNG